MALEKDFDYDACIIGSSPFGLYQANLLSKQGKRVLIVESRENIGGAWQVKTLWGHDNIEIGCHLIPASYQIYHFLENTLNIKLKEMSPTPKRVVNYKFYEYNNPYPLILSKLNKIKIALTSSLKNNSAKPSKPNENYKIKKLSIYKRVSTLYSKLNFAQFKEVIKTDLSFYYPAQGTSALISACHRHINMEKSTILLNTKVNKATQLENGGVRLSINTEKNLTVKKLYITGQSFFDELKHYNGIKISKNAKKYMTHIIIGVTGVHTKKISYIEVHNSQLIYRASDVTDFMDNLPKGERYFCIQAHNSIESISNTEIDLIVQELIKLNVISKKARLENYHIDQHVMHLFHDEELKKIKSFSDIVFLETGNISKLKKLT